MTVMTDADLKHLVIDSARETRRHFDTVAEGLRQQVQIVAATDEPLFPTLSTSRRNAGGMLNAISSAIVSLTD